MWFNSTVPTMSTLDPIVTAPDSQEVVTPVAQGNAPSKADIQAQAKADKAAKAKAKREAAKIAKEQEAAILERMEAENSFNSAKYDQVPNEPTTTKALTSVKAQVVAELKGEYNSLSSIFNFLRKRPKAIERITDEIAEKKLVNGKILHDIFNVGSMSTLAFFMLPSEVSVTDKKTNVTTPKTTFTLNQVVAMAVRAAKCPLPVEAVHKYRAEYKYYHAIPGEVKVVGK